jgi:hypothetical protein
MRSIKRAKVSLYSGVVLLIIGFVFAFLGEDRKAGYLELEKLGFPDCLNNIDPTVMNLDVAQTTSMSWNFGEGVIIRNGLVPHRLNQDDTATRNFAVPSNIQSIKGQWRVTGGYASVKGAIINLNEIHGNFYEDDFHYSGRKESLLESLGHVEAVMRDPISKDDYHKHIEIELNVNVLYPYVEKTDSYYSTKEEVVTHKFDLYVISPEEFAIRNAKDKYDTIEKSRKMNIYFHVFAWLSGIPGLVILIISGWHLRYV